MQSIGELDPPWIKSGQIGGWIEKEDNLSHDGMAWVFGDAIVCDNANISGNAHVCDKAVVCNNAKVYGNARIRATIYENAKVYGNAIICKNSKVHGDVVLCGNITVFANANIFSSNHILNIDTTGNRDDSMTFYRDKDNEITVNCRHFFGKTHKFLQELEKRYGKSKHVFVCKKAVELAKLYIDLSSEQSNDDITE